jgi:hypothetical protein
VIEPDARLEADLHVLHPAVGDLTADLDDSSQPTCGRRLSQVFRGELGRSGTRPPICSVAAAAVSSSAEISGVLPFGGAP